jgi:hypothetical protein
MNVSFERRYHPSFLFAGLLCLFTMLLVGCGTEASTNSTANTRSNSVPQQAAQSADIKPGVQPCPATVQSPSYWSPIVGVQPNVNKVEDVSCANLLGVNELQALVTVRTLGSGGDLDLHVFTHITQAQPAELFKMLSLYKGQTKISPYSTLLTGEVDLNSSVNKGVNSNANLQQDLFREFKWSDGAGTFMPVSFPGLYPDLTRFQAETDQQMVKGGQDVWKLDAVKTAINLTVDLLKWPATVNATIASGGGKNDGDAVVNVKGPGVAGGSIQVKLSRLEGNSSNGIWIATDVNATGLDITSPLTRDRISNPLKVTGKGKAFEAVIGKIAVLDHTYTDIGDAQAKGAIGMGDTTFTASVDYTSSFKNGLQEGIVVLYSYSNADGSIASVVLRKVLISA